MEKVFLVLLVTWTILTVGAGESEQNGMTNSPIRVVNVVYKGDQFEIVDPNEGGGRVRRSFKKGKGDDGIDGIICKIFKKKCGGYRQRPQYGPPQRPQYGPPPQQPQYGPPRPQYGYGPQHGYRNQGGKGNKISKIGDEISYKIQKFFNKFDKGGGGGKFNKDF